MRGYIVFIVFFIGFFLTTLFVSAKLTGETVTGEVSSQFFGINITVVNATPEVDTPSSSGSSGGSGGGGSSVGVYKNFSLFTDKIHLTLKQGEVESFYFDVHNTGDVKMSFSVSLSGIKDFLRIRENSFDLGPGDLKSVRLDFISEDDTIPDVYVGKILVRAEGMEKEIIVIMEVESRKALFDIEVEIPERFQRLAPGEDLVVNVRLFEVERVGRVDVRIEYGILDSEGKIISSYEETLAVDQQARFVQSLKVPDDTPEGNYFYYIKVVYGGQAATASEGFIVFFPEGDAQTNTSFFVIIFIFLLILLFLIYILRKIFHIYSTPKRYRRRRK